MTNSPSSNYPRSGEIERLPFESDGEYQWRRLQRAALIDAMRQPSPSRAMPRRIEPIAPLYDKSKELRKAAVRGVLIGLPVFFCLNWFILLVTFGSWWFVVPFTLIETALLSAYSVGNMWTKLR